MNENEMPSDQAQSSVLDELLSLLELEKIEENTLRGQSQDLGFGKVFGGQVPGQSLSAILHTVPEERTVHSSHCCFLRPGDPKRPNVYEVDCVRDGKNLTARRAVAIQHGQPTLTVSASPQRAETGFEYRDDIERPINPEAFVADVEHSLPARPNGRRGVS